MFQNKILTYLSKIEHEIMLIMSSENMYIKVCILKRLEVELTEYISSNMTYLYDNMYIDSYLQIRDIMLMLIERMILNISYVQYYNKKELFNWTFNDNLPLELRLRYEELNNGYLPCMSSPSKAHCGCTTMCYSKYNTLNSSYELNDIIFRSILCDNHINE